jgi:hypothetical protein
VVLGGTILQKDWCKRDFIYLCIILCIVLISVISFFLADSTRAGEALNFGATAVSIVLAVIAIVMTIVDSAGQKNNVYELKKSAESLAESIIEERRLLGELRDELQSIDDLKQNFTQSIDHFITLRNKLDELIEKNKDSSSSIDVKDLKEVINKTDLKSSVTVRQSSIPSQRGTYVFEIQTNFSNEDFDSELDEFLNYLNSGFKQKGIKFNLRAWNLMDDRLKIETRTNIEENIEVKNLIRDYPNIKLLTLYDKKPIEPL